MVPANLVLGSVCLRFSDLRVEDCAVGLLVRVRREKDGRLTGQTLIAKEMGTTYLRPAQCSFCQKDMGENGSVSLIGQSVPSTRILQSRNRPLKNLSSQNICRKV